MIYVSPHPQIDDYILLLLKKGEHKLMHTFTGHPCFYDASFISHLNDTM